MCTAITLQTTHSYFGRNLDLEYSHNENVVIAPRNYLFRFRNMPAASRHYAIIGVAVVENGYPLYFDGINEFGLGMAALNFPGNAKYNSVNLNSDNVAPFELIPWILCQCKTVTEARVSLERLNLTDCSFNSEYPLTPLHWIIADKTCAITLEPMTDGLRIMDNSVGILTNNPPFEYHMQRLNDFMNLTTAEPQNNFSPKICLNAYSRGMGGLGIPGDLSSSSRFIRAAFTKLNSVCGKSEDESVSQFFHILNSVAQQKGCVKVGNSYEKTVYSSCCNQNLGIYYFTTYENSRISAVDLHRVNLDSSQLLIYPMYRETDIRRIN